MVLFCIMNEELQQIGRSLRNPEHKTPIVEYYLKDVFDKLFEPVEKNPAYWKALADLNEEEQLVAKANEHRRKRIGIVGPGRFGTFLAQCLSNCRIEHHILFLDEQNVVTQIGGIKSSLENFFESDFIFICVPISDFQSWICNYHSSIGKSIIIDCLSVKEHPKNTVEYLNEYGKSKIRYQGSHPMFGVSDNPTLDGKSFVLTHPVLPEVRQFLEDCNCDITQMSAESHDRIMARNQVIMHLVGKVLDKFDYGDEDISTETGRTLETVMQKVCSNDPRLFKDMVKYNRFAKEEIDKFKKVVNSIDI